MNSEIQKAITDDSFLDEPVGGPSYIDISKMTQAKTYTVVGAKKEETKFGDKIIFSIGDANNKISLISNWNMRSDMPFTPRQLIGHDITLTPTEDKKKVIVSW